MEFGKFPWEEIFALTITTLTGYFSGRYRDITKKRK